MKAYLMTVMVLDHDGMGLDEAVRHLTDEGDYFGTVELFEADPKTAATRAATRRVPRGHREG